MQEIPCKKDLPDGTKSAKKRKKAETGFPHVVTLQL